MAAKQPKRPRKTVPIVPPKKPGKPKPNGAATRTGGNPVFSKLA